MAQAVPALRASEERLAVVEQIMLAGQLDRRSILDLAKEWHVTSRSVWGLKYRVEARWRAQAKKRSPDTERVDILARIRAGQARALEKCDFKAYTLMLTLEARILGQLRDRLEVSGPNGGPILQYDLSRRPLAELLDEMDELRRRLSQPVIDVRVSDEQAP